jgi:S1-C subfamily serine protease
MSFSTANIRRALCLGLAIMGAPLYAAAADRSVHDAVVKVYVTQQRSDYTMPWQGGRMGSGTGSGFIIAGRRILTNAHVVSDARYLLVRKLSDPRMFPARVEFLAHDCDIACLTVDEAEFFEGVPSLRFSDELPDLGDEVSVLGYPLGGTRLSLTRGVVSRLDYSMYTHSEVDQHLVLQVDAAINPGNSGGPVFFKNRVVGLAFQGLAAADNIGYAIPQPVLARFLKDIEDGVYHGYPELGVMQLDTRNKALRDLLGMPEGLRGAAITGVDPFGAARGHLQPRDVLLSINGHAIGEDGTVNLGGKNVHYAEILERKQWGERIEFRVWRNRQTIPVELPLLNVRDSFVYRNLYGDRPRYLIKAGLVFTPLTRELLRAHERNMATPAVQQLFYYSQYAKLDGLYANRSEFLVLMRRLPHPVNTFADPFMNGIVEEVNGVRVSDLRALAAAFSVPKGGFHVIRLAGMQELLVLEADAVAAADREIPRMYQIQETSFLGEEASREN